MDKWALETLDYPKVKEMIKEHATSDLGRKKIERVMPTAHFDEVKERLAETQEGMDLIRVKGEVPLRGIANIEPSLRRAKVGGMLSSEELLAIASTVRAGRLLKNWFRQIDMKTAPLSRLRRMGEQIVSLKSLEEEITRCIDEHGNILDQASNTLQAIRKEIESLKNQIQKTLQELMSQPRIQKMLQEPIVTQRQHRYVMPVKQEYRGVFKGIIHDQSSSGATLFIEPEKVVFLNNQLHERELAEQKEIKKILIALTELVARHVDELQNNLEILARIDFIVAKARFAEQMKATCPILSAEWKLRLKKARHPLLAKEIVVPIDVSMDRQQQGIVITGPNTGGKTVSLKTIGLMALMTQSGFPIPVEEESLMPVFSGIFADIGDEQSIEQSLSTFSGHMKNMIHILEQIDEYSLVLLDEIGAGTDPTEGAALAIAILEYVLKRGSFFVATTHYSELKIFAHSSKKIVNASVEFDLTTLKPTYRLLMGVPGQSNAFAIAERLGLPKQITERARREVTQESQALEKMIASLAEEQKKAAELRSEAEQYHSEAMDLFHDLQEKMKLWEQEKQHLRQQAKAEARQIVAKAQTEAKEILQEMREWAKQQHAPMKEHEWARAKERLSQLVSDDLSDDPSEEETWNEQPEQELKINDEVLVLPYNQTGTVVEQIDEQHVFVQIGQLKIKVKKGQLKKKQSTKTETQPMIQRQVDASVQTELDLRGKMVDEAINEVDQYLDRALLAGYVRVYLIHGKGTGALRKGIHQFLRRHPLVKSFRLGSYAEGGAGVTVIQLDSGREGVT